MGSIKALGRGAQSRPAGRCYQSVYTITRDGYLSNWHTRIGGGRSDKREPRAVLPARGRWVAVTGQGSVHDSPAPRERRGRPDHGFREADITNFGWGGSRILDAVRVTDAAGRGSARSAGLSCVSDC